MVNLIPQSFDDYMNIFWALVSLAFIIETYLSMRVSAAVTKVRETFNLKAEEKKSYKIERLMLYPVRGCQGFEVENRIRINRKGDIFVIPLL